MKKKIRKIDKLALVFFVCLLSLYVLLKVVNRLTYPDFVFSKLYIQPSDLKLPTLISLLPVAVLWIPRINFRKLFSIRFALLVFTLLIIAFNFFRIYKAKWETYQFIIAHPFANYDEKMRKAIGTLSYNYAQFVVKYTFGNATLLIPPQAFPWPSSGNVGYFRYFVYPRKLISGDEFMSPSKDVLGNIDYVLLNWGETDMVEDGHTHDWPKFDVPAEKIIFMNEDGSFGGEVIGDYHYNDYKGKKVWGIIVVKH